MESVPVFSNKFYHTFTLLIRDQYLYPFRVCHLSIFNRAKNLERISRIIR